MGKAQKRKRFFRSLICMVLVVAMLVVDIPNLGLVLKVLANPRPDQITVLGDEGRTETAGRKQERTTPNIESEMVRTNPEIEMESPAFEIERSTPETEDVTVEESAQTEPTEIVTSERLETDLYETEMATSPQEETEVETETETEIETNKKELNVKNKGKGKTAEFVKTVLPEDIVYDEIIEGDTILSSGGVIRDKKIWYQGDVLIDSNLIFSNCTIKISGSVSFQSGCLNIINSIIWVEGDFRIQYKNAEGKYGQTKGYLNDADNAKLVVKGDFYTECTNSYNRFHSGLSMELYGDFVQIGKTFLNRQYSQSTNEKVIFVGKEQHLSMGTDVGSRLGTIQVSNSDGKIYADTPIYGIALASNTVIKGEAVALQGTTKGYDLTVEGDYLGTQLCLDKGTTMHIMGDYRIQTIPGMSYGLVKKTATKVVRSILYKGCSFIVPSTKRR